ncbi:MAG TPA: ATP synthase F1 subunit gamma [Myxococcales bacterium]|jgi:F-type H+-transporting ATPase subunit gamma|nr:ATP synthase F1 subunit gamma [Myxococcales bacterium]
MASLRTIRTRIKSVKSTQKITKALKLVDAAKLRRAQDAVLRARPYAQMLDEVLSSLAGGQEEGAPPPHPLMEVREPKKIEILMLTSDRGLCGGFNSNLLRRAQRFMNEEASKYESVQFGTVGRRGRDWVKKRGYQARKDYPGVVGKLRFPVAKEIADDLIAEYTHHNVDAVFLLYNRFKSAATQEITLSQLLPIVPAKEESPKAEGAKGFITPEHLYEPGREQLLQHLIPKQLATQIWRALLESGASEHAARMTAMDAATKNASEKISSLSLEYNRARQAAITKELMEIVSGAEALK